MEVERYSFQVKLENVKFAFDEEAASALELDPEMSAVERAECYLLHFEKIRRTEPIHDRLHVAGLIRVAESHIF
jgi:hypothetical protein